jgi:hypothetical protein
LAVACAFIRDAAKFLRSHRGENPLAETDQPATDRLFDLSQNREGLLLDFLVAAKPSVDLGCNGRRWIRTSDFHRVSEATETETLAISRVMPRA